jgi:hypothetical protein
MTIITTQPKSTPGRALTTRGHPVTDLGRPMLQAGDDPDLYDRLHAGMTAAVAPRDVIEEIWVRDVVDLVWEALSLRRLKALLLIVSARRGLDQVISPLFKDGRAYELANDWFAGKKEAVREVEQALAKAGLTMEAVAAQTLAIKLDDIERIDRMIMNAEARRNATLREVERHRETLAARLRCAAEDIQDVEFAEIAPQDEAERGR